MYLDTDANKRFATACGPYPILCATRPIQISSFLPQQLYTLSRLLPGPGRSDAVALVDTVDVESLLREKRDCWLIGITSIDGIRSTLAFFFGRHARIGESSIGSDNILFDGVGGHTVI